MMAYSLGWRVIFSISDEELASDSEIPSRLISLSDRLYISANSKACNPIGHSLARTVRVYLFQGISAIALVIIAIPSAAGCDFIDKYTIHEQ